MFSKIVKDDALPKGADSADESSKRSSKESVSISSIRILAPSITAK